MFTVSTRWMCDFLMPSDFNTKQVTNEMLHELQHKSVCVGVRGLVLVLVGVILMENVYVHQKFHIKARCNSFFLHCAVYFKKFTIKIMQALVHLNVYTRISISAVHACME